jgi:hypothetical protein
MTLLAAAALSACGGSAAPPKAATCVPTYVYSNVKSEGSALDVVDLETADNATNSSEIFTLTESRTAAVSIQDSTINYTRKYAEVSGTGIAAIPAPYDALGVVKARAVYNSVHETDSAVNMTSTVTTGSQVQLPVPAGATAYGLFGVVMKVTRGNLKSLNCPSLTQDSAETVILPEEYEWCTWVRGPDEFAAGGLSPCVVVAYDLAH